MAVLVKNEMNRNVKTLGPEDTVKHAAEKMSRYWMGSIVIVEGKKVVGIVTERDILSKLVLHGKNPSSIKIKEIMSGNVITIEENKTIEDAVKLMKANDIKKLPVMNKGNLVGIITTTDIITAMDEEIKDGVNLESYRDLKVLVRRHSIDLKSETAKNQVLTFLMSNSLFPMDSISVTKAVTRAIKNIIYVTVNKPYFSIIGTLKKKGIRTDSMYFIDASSEEGDVSKGANYEKLSGPSDMTEIILSVDRCLKSKKFEGLIFDSISTLLAYHDEELVIRFAHSLVNKLRNTNVKGIFFCTKEDMKTNLMKNLNMLADYSADIDKRGEIV
ncbi:MAG: CBS domain-containing protein [Candidatus Aenigmarchaeota archaeon]|nr:CBS domain-containing protein [Candidatus Aenigmarchaeota archaeon]